MARQTYRGPAAHPSSRRASDADVEGVHPVAARWTSAHDVVSRVPRPVFAQKPTVIGHRGAGVGRVDGRLENTLESFAAAVDSGTAWIELDVRRSRDGGLAVVHNPADVDGTYVVERDLAALQDAGIPSLEQVLEQLPLNVGVDVDLKSSVEDALLPDEQTTAALVAPVLDRERLRRNLLVTSFDPASLLILRERAPSVPLGLLTWFTFPLHMAVAAAAHLGVEVVAAQVGSFGPDGPTARHRGAAHAVEVAHRAGLEVIAWCPTPTEAVDLVTWGVDALVVDDVAR